MDDEFNLKLAVQRHLPKFPQYTYDFFHTINKLIQTMPKTADQYVEIEEMEWYATCEQNATN